jgi:hypothetical protein
MNPNYQDFSKEIEEHLNPLISRIQRKYSLSTTVIRDLSIGLHNYANYIQLHPPIRLNTI